MTTTSAPPPAAAPAPGAPPAAAQAAPRHAAAAADPGRRRSRTVPASLRLLLITLLVASVAYGAVGTWTVIQHASAAQDVVSTSEPLSLAAQRMYQDLSDADVTATTAFLAGPNVPLAARQRYAADINSAAAGLTSRTPGSSAAWQRSRPGCRSTPATCPRRRPSGCLATG